MKNLLVRTLSGAVFLALFLTALLWHPAAYGVKDPRSGQPEY